MLYMPIANFSVSLNLRDTDGKRYSTTFSVTDKLSATEDMRCNAAFSTTDKMSAVDFEHRS